MVRVLTITAIVAILSGCASCPVPVTVDKPARPVLIDPPPSLVDAVDAILDAAANHPDR